MLEGQPSFSEEHMAALNRRRRIVANFDSSYQVSQFEEMPRQAEEVFRFADDPETLIDSIFFSWGEGHIAPYPSAILPLYDEDKYRRWVEAGVDVVRLFLESAHERGIEAFFSYRINGSDNDLGPQSPIPFKLENPDWLHRMPWGIDVWDFRVPEVRAYKLGILREAARNYDHDGMEIDFARNAVVLPPGVQWEHRECITQFMQEVRRMLQEEAARRGRPFLLAARVGETIEGNRLDGLDVEAWVRKGLVDIFALGCRSFDVDVQSFRQLVRDTPIKLYPCFDDHHAADGYSWAPLELFRGAFANWYRQGADGIYTFNLAHDLESKSAVPDEVRQRHLQVFREAGDPLRLVGDKIFFLHRRGGEHAKLVVPDVHNWHTPRHMYGNTNMLAPLPTALSGDGKTDTIFRLYIGDDFGPATGAVELTLRLLLHDGGAGGYEQTTDSVCERGGGDGRLQSTAIEIWRRRNYLFNSPPAGDVGKRLEVWLNNALLTEPEIAEGWLVYHVRPAQCAAGANMVSINYRARAGEDLTLEKLELHACYLTPRWKS